MGEFTQQYPEITYEWHSKSNYLGLLSAKDEYQLQELIAKANSIGIRYSVFREPDIGNQITAIALAPGPKTKRLCSKLPLALKG